MTKKPYPSEKQERFIVRLPDGMRDNLREAAAANNRSMNAEIVARLQQTFDERPPLEAAMAGYADLLDKIAQLEYEIAMARKDALAQCGTEMLVDELVRRLPSELQTGLVEAAERSRRTVSAEIVQRLEGSLEFMDELMQLALKAIFAVHAETNRQASADEVAEKLRPILAERKKPDLPKIPTGDLVGELLRRFQPDQIEIRIGKVGDAGPKK